MHLRRLIALIMVCAYVLLPLDGFAAHQPPADSVAAPAAPGPGGKTLAVAAAVASDSPSRLLSAPEISSGSAPSHCPCSERHGSDDCDSSCSCCSCCSYLAPLTAQMAGLPSVPDAPYLVYEPIQRFPEVYLPIFVPPQNRG